jgi:hypothetical protein
LLFGAGRQRGAAPLFCDDDFSRPFALRLVLGFLRGFFLLQGFFLAGRTTLSSAHQRPD